MTRAKSEDRLAELVRAGADVFPRQRAMGWLSDLVALDRVQVSLDVERAATLVSAAARTVGLQDVTTLSVPPGSSSWTFSVPDSWTPLRAVLTVRNDQGEAVHTQDLYPEAPCSLAIHSAAAPPGSARGRVLTHHPADGPVPRGARGAWVVVRRAAGLTAALFEELLDAAALGLITDAASGDDAVGRIELPERSGLIACSLVRRDLDALLEAATGGGLVECVVTLDDTPAGMPVVTGVTDGDDEHDEVLVMAHLCHRAPGANDNGSGVVVALGVAAGLASLELATRRRWRRRVRFLWAPEFSGTAAWLHHRLVQGHRPPLAVINLDMVGENQQLCGGPLVVEQTPDHVGSCLEAVIEAALRRLPAPRTWSGATAAPTWSWVSSPFAGASDHAIFADLHVARPAVQLGHWPDRFNHSDGDTLDAVDPLELQRVGAVVAATCAYLATADTDDAAWLQATTSLRAAHRLMDVLEHVSANDDLKAAGAATSVDVFAVDHASWLLQQRLNSGLADLAHAHEVIAGQQDRAGVDEDTEQWARWLRTQHDLHARLLTALPGPFVLPGGASSLSERVFRPCWPGPFNLRGLYELSSPQKRRWLSANARAGRSAYAITLAVALALDGQRPFAEVLRLASASSGLAVPLSLGEGLVHALAEVGWLEDVRK